MWNPKWGKIWILASLASRARRSPVEPGSPPRSRRYFPPLYQKHERGTDLCVWLEEFLEKQILGFLSFLDFTTILLGIYQETRPS